MCLYCQKTFGTACNVGFEQFVSRDRGKDLGRKRKEFTISDTSKALIPRIIEIREDALEEVGHWHIISDRHGY